MRKFLLAAILAPLVSLAGGSAAQARDYPWCAWYDRDTYNCGFVTYQQCLATVYGAGGICARNPRYFFEAPRWEPRRKPRRHR